MTKDEEPGADGPPEEPATIRPGDIVQITDKDQSTYTALAIVDERRPWGVMASVWAGTGSIIPLRLRDDQFVPVGTAMLISPETAAARRDVLATELLIQEESEHG